MSRALDILAIAIVAGVAVALAWNFPAQAAGTAGAGAIVWATARIMEMEV